MMHYRLIRQGVRERLCQCGNPRGRKPSCQECENAKARRYYRETPERRRRASVRGSANAAMQCGNLERQSCEVCGGLAEMHHEDYSKPLEVRWLCKDHHQLVTNGDLWLMPKYPSEFALIAKLAKMFPAPEVYQMS